MSRSSRPGALWLWSVGILAAAVGASLGTPAFAAAAFKETLIPILGTNRITVILEAWPPPALWWGRVGRMTVVALDARAGDLALEQFTATLYGVRVDPRALYADRALLIRSIAAGSARGLVSQEALARSLALQPGVRVDTVLLRPDGVVVRGALRVFGTDVAVEGAGRFVLAGSDTLDLILDRVTLGGSGASTVVGGRLATRIPSVLRIPPLPLGLRLTDVHTEDGRLVLDAATGPS